MVQPWILTCPASRGIGFHLTRRLLKTTTLPIIATARSDLADTKRRLLEGMDVDEARLEVLELDVTDENTVLAAAEHCKARFTSSYLHLALCVPGILHAEKSPTQINYSKALETYKVNVLGPLLLIKHFSGFLPKKATPMASSTSSSSSSSPSPPEGLSAAAIFAIMSARVGSISDNVAGGWYSYRGSKAAVNQTVKSLDVFLKIAAGAKAMSVGLHPGTVKTGLSKNFWASTPKEKLFEPEFAAERLLGVLEGMKAEGRGKCWDWDGKEIPP